jgi:hypothetical protein
VLWVTPSALLVGILVLMARRGVRARYPIFFSYIILQLVSFVLQFATYHFGSYSSYFYAYWVPGGVSVFVGFAVIYEIFLNVFRPYDELRRLGILFFRWATAILILVAIVTAVTTQHDTSRILTLVLAFERSVRIMQCGLVLLLFIFSSHLGLSFRSHLVGIALGFGVFASIELSIVTLRAMFGPAANWYFSTIKSAAYLCTTAIWTFYLARPDPVRIKVEHASETRRWDDALARMIHPIPQQSFLPNLEDAVDRIMRESIKAPE